MHNEQIDVGGSTGVRYDAADRLTFVRDSLINIVAAVTSALPASGHSQEAKACAEGAVILMKFSDDSAWPKLRVTA